LVGTAVGGRPALTVAVIEDRSTGTQNSYREGEQIGQLLIEKIGAGYVLLRTDSGLIKLGAGLGVTTAHADSAITPQAAIVDKQEVASAVSDYERLVQEIRVRPRLEEGRPAGFLIYNIAPGSVFERMGLENGDVISAVNGRPLETATPVIEFYAAIKEGGLLTLDVKQPEGSRTLHIVIQ
jgi:general secretion pathway protein C